MPLKVSDGMGAWIKDFQKSDAPQFKGKSDKERRDQAIAAYLSAKRGDKNESWETVGKTPDGNYKIQRDPETGARRKVPAQMRNEETPTGKQVKQAIGIARDKRYAKGNMTGAVKTMNKINPKLSNHPRVKDELQKQNEDAFSKDAVDSGKVKTGPSKSRMDAMKKQDDNRPTLRKKTNEQMGVKHAFRYVTKSGQGTHYHHSSDKADATKAIEKSTGQRVLGINHIGTGIPSRREDKASLRNESKQVNEILPALATVARVAAPAVARAGVKTLGRAAAGAARGVAKAAAPAVGAYAAKKVVDKTKNEDKAADRDALQKAMDVFKKRGGKITKVAPGKAAGYHGKDDPGKDVKGMMDRGDTKTMPRKKKVGSMK